MLEDIVSDCHPCQAIIYKLRPGTISLYCTGRKMLCFFQDFVENFILSYQQSTAKAD